MKLFILTLLLSGCFLRRQPAPVEDTFEPFAEEIQETIAAPDSQDFEIQEIVRIQQENSVVRWPRDQDFSFKITYCSDARLQMQWRQRCGNFDSDWYDMREKGMVDPLDADYMVTRSQSSDTALCAEIITVMAAKMREFPRSGCEWSFRTRLVSSRNVYEWVNLNERIVLADPGEFEQMQAPKIELIKPR